ncbi:Fructokinase [Shigella dysenteriae WRSd5]|nr:Fructokinase [Shigella dysenteriae WRSd5]
MALDIHGACRSERSRGTFIYVYGPPQCRSFFRDDRLALLATWRHGEWLHLCSIALSAEPSRTSAFTAMTAIRHAGGFVSFDPNIREDLWQDEHLLRLCLRQALQLADVVKLSEEE